MSRIDWVRAIIVVFCLILMLLVSNLHMYVLDRNAWHINKAEQYFKIGQYQTSMLHADAAIRDNKSKERAYELKARLLIREEKYYAAQLLIDKFPDSKQILFNAEMNFNMRNLKEAQDGYLEYLKLNNQSMLAYTQLGIINLMNGNLDKSENYLNMALASRKPKLFASSVLARLHASKAIIYRIKGQTKQAKVEEAIAWLYSPLSNSKMRSWVQIDDIF